MLEKSEFKDESQYFRFHADEEMEGTSSKNKQLRNDFKLVENILAKRLLVGAELSSLHLPSQTCLQAWELGNLQVVAGEVGLTLGWPEVRGDFRRCLATLPRHQATFLARPPS